MKVVIADRSENLVNDIRKLLDERFSVVIGAANLDLIQFICNEKPDILFLDMTYPGYDGITVLRAVRAFGMNAKLIVASRYFSYFVEDALEELDVSYLMRKPCNPSAVASIITQLAELPRNCRLSPPDVKQQLKDILLVLGLSPKYMGFSCLMQIIPMALEDFSQYYMKQLYPQTAKILGCSAAQVERGIRTVIESAWKNRDDSIWSMYFPYNNDGVISQPSNSEFIDSLASVLLKVKEE